ncbi:MAG: phosphoribosylglycinamide formyltransferase [Myxococcota bacterium]
MRDDDRVRVGVLASGSGSNLQALLDATAAPDHPARIAVVGVDRPKAGALGRAQAAGVATFVELLRDHPDRDAFDRALVAQLKEHGVEWLCLAGYMKIVGAPLLEAFPGRILNVHPSLLPAFPGLHAPQQAIDSGATVSGCTVHLVDAGTDTGPIVAQREVPVLPDDDAASLHVRIQAVEHVLFPEVLGWAAAGRIRADGSLRD